MRPSFVVSLLLLSLLLTKSQGIRLGKVSLAFQQHKQHAEESTLLKKSNTHAEEALHCMEEQCTGRIENRKLVTTSASTTQSLAKNMKNVNVNGEAEEVKANALSTSKLQDLSHEHYPDLVDITEMDYSPAMRKPPIHN